MKCDEKKSNDCMENLVEKQRSKKNREPYFESEVYLKTHRIFKITNLYAVKRALKKQILKLIHRNKTFN